MRRRAELVDETRLRITEAAVRLHTTVGPANTSITGIAEEAGVTRLTVYRHFPDLEELFDACRGHWMSEHQPPDLAAWRAIPGLEDRARQAFADLYGWYGQNADDL
ncbi:MAG TPA: helix-turn-helix domain-containing protein, partial [Candidatus Limnocylindrales bacterium]